MSDITIDSDQLNISNGTCSSSFFWDYQARESRNARLYTCIIALVVHTIFWSQLVFCSSVRQKSMQWIYAYLIVDICLIFRFFFTYIAHTIPSACHVSRTWRLFMCYFDATIDNYLNVLEVYILLALNICRYVQIKYNRNLYRIDKKTLISTHLGIYIAPLIYMLIQLFFGWTVLEGYGTAICQIIYSNVYIQIFNITFTFALPILMNLFVIYTSAQHVRLVSSLQRAQHHVSARDKYHRSLIIQFILFYTIWLALWSPNVIVYQISIASTNITAIVRLMNFIHIILDPIIIAALDIRFWQTWKRFFRFIIVKIRRSRTNQVRIQPSITNPKIFTIKSTRFRTTTF